MKKKFTSSDIEVPQFLNETKIHYPTQIHLQPAAESLNYKMGGFPVAERLANRIMSLPVYSELTDGELDCVVGAIKDFFER